MPAPIDLTGQRFGRLIALSLAPKRPNSANRYWVCRCECGNEVSILTSSLTRKETKSCGCLQRDVVASMSTTHGATKGKKETREFRIWMGMIQRCENPKYQYYHRYGGRGISVCERWRHSFTLFLEDMGDCPPGRSIDRIDNDGNYEPSNCRWATSLEQQNNTTRSAMLTCRGETRTIAEWSRIRGINYMKIHARIRRLNWSVDEALNLAPHKTTAHSQSSVWTQDEPDAR